MESLEIYREKVAWPLWFHLLLATGVVLCLYAGWRLLAAGGWWAGLPAASGLVVGLVWWRMRHLSVEFAPSGAAFGFVGPGRRVPAAQIRSARPEVYAWPRYMGWGFRFGWKPRDRAYSVLGHRRGIRIEFRDDRGRDWSVFVSCSDPERAAAALQP